MVSIEKAINEIEAVFKIVDDRGKIIILNANKLVYILLKYCENVERQASVHVAKTTYILYETIKMVLSESENQMLHVSKLADIIYDRKLFV